MGGGYGYANGVVVSPWNKLFRKEVIKGVKASGYLGEDEEMNDYVNSKNCKVVVIRDEFYYWCQNLASMSNQPFSAKRFHFLDMLKKRCELFDDEYIVSESEKLYCNIFIEYYYKAKEREVTVSDRYFLEFRKMHVSLWKRRSCGLKFHLRMLLFTLSPLLYKKIVNCL